MSNLLVNSVLPACICDECGRPTDAEPDIYDGKEQRLCDSCDCDYVWCNICNDRLHAEDSLCRHLFYSGEWEDYGGCGSSDWESHKTSFFAVLDKIGDEAAKALTAALRLHRYFHQFRGSIFGYESFTADWWDETGQRRGYGHLFTESLFEEEEEAMAIGVQWLASLWAGTGYPKEGDGGLPMTPQADDRTAEWIEEWLRDRPSL